MEIEGLWVPSPFSAHGVPTSVRVRFAAIGVPVSPAHVRLFFVSHALCMALIPKEAIMPKATAVPVVERTIGHSVGITVGQAVDLNLDVVDGYQAARDPSLVEARKAYNMATRSALTAQLLADLKR